MHNILLERVTQVLYLYEMLVFVLVLSLLCRVVLTVQDLLESQEEVESCFAEHLIVETK